MRHRQTALAYLLVPICLLAGCRAAGGSTAAKDQSSVPSSSAKSISSLPSGTSSSVSAAVSRFSDGFDPDEALAGRWVLLQVQTVNGSPSGHIQDKQPYPSKGGPCHRRRLRPATAGSGDSRTIEFEAHWWHLRRGLCCGTRPPLRRSGSSRLLEHDWDDSMGERALAAGCPQRLHDLDL